MHDTIKDHRSRPTESDISLTLHRVIDAPVAAVYAAWTDASILERWFVPSDAAVARVVADATVGGQFLIEMRGSDGTKFIVKGLYREVLAHRRLVHTWCWEGSDLESLVTVEFEPTAAGKTRLTLTHSRFPEDKSRDEHERGWNGCLAKLDDAVARHTAESI
ncbi:MAG: SRPBCC domain-containing protein [Gammaproteobacteria bacterium]|nr:SRPBCC domain-containing protein [Gammaproteobacteria bacterium]MDE0273798.1 SRPBCC domain-containing protein [Gammaproteobacteria bacterium]